MELNEFARKVCCAMEKEFCGECRVELRQVTKNNGVVLHGMLIVSKERNIMPTIYLDTFWEAYEGGMTFAEVVRRLMEIYRRETCRKNIDMDFFKDFTRVKDRICYRLVGKRSNKAMLTDVPHIEYLDLAVCFFYAYQGPELGEGTILIHNSHMELWGTNTLELLQMAEKNTPRLFPHRVYYMEEMLEDLLQDTQPEMRSVARECRAFLQDIPLKVLSNERKNEGAACVLYEGVLERQAAQYGGSFYILPSSIHELIMMPDSGETSAEMLRLMIHDVNRTQVSPEEVLSDSLYYYDAKEKKMKIVS